MWNSLYIKLSCKQTFVASRIIGELSCKQGALSCCHLVLPEAWQGPGLSSNRAHDPKCSPPSTIPCKNSCRQNPVIFMPLLQSIVHPGDNHWNPILRRYNSCRCCWKAAQARRNPPRKLHPLTATVRNAHCWKVQQFPCFIKMGIIRPRGCRGAEYADEWKHTVLIGTTTDDK